MPEWERGSGGGDRGTEGSVTLKKRAKTVENSYMKANMSFKEMMCICISLHLTLHPVVILTTSSVGSISVA